MLWSSLSDKVLLFAYILVEFLMKLHKLYISKRHCSILFRDKGLHFVFCQPKETNGSAVMWIQTMTMVLYGGIRVSEPALAAAHRVCPSYRCEWLHNLLAFRHGSLQENISLKSQFFNLPNTFNTKIHAWIMDSINQSSCSVVWVKKEKESQTQYPLCLEWFV